jgi:tryptophan-rich sensory protein
VVIFSNFITWNRNQKQFFLKLFFFTWVYTHITAFSWKSKIQKKKELKKKKCVLELSNVS